MANVLTRTEIEDQLSNVLVEFSFYNQNYAVFQGTLFSNIKVGLFIDINIMKYFQNNATLPVSMFLDKNTDQVKIMLIDEDLTILYQD